MAEEHGIDLTRVPGTGIGGRVSKRDVLAYLDALQAGQVQPPAAPSDATASANGQEAAQAAPAQPLSRRRRRAPSAAPATARPAPQVGLPGGYGLSAAGL